MKTNDIYNEITNAIVKELENGIVPWQKPWTNQTFMGCISHTSGRPYSLLNQWLLKHRSGEWLTFGQIQKEGGRVKAGEKASTVVFWTFVEKIEKHEVIEFTDGEEVVGTETRDHIKRYPILKGYKVFHIDQCEGIAPRYNNEPVKYEHAPIEIAEQMVAEYVKREGVKLEIKNTDRAFYRPSMDYVEIPEREQFKCGAEFYSTLFHELTHSTGHAKRLNREGIAGLHFFGDKDYSKEELVAEIGAAFACQIAGIDCAEAFQNSAAYLRGWLRALKGDKRMIVSAAAQAERAIDYLMKGAQNNK